MFRIENLDFEKNSSFKCKKMKTSQKGGIQKNPVKCEIVKNEVAKIEYYFENVGEETMYPKKINVFERTRPDVSWIHYREINYADFKVKTDFEKTTFKNLPIGNVCLIIFYSIIIKI